MRAKNLAAVLVIGIMLATAFGGCIGGKEAKPPEQEPGAKPPGQESKKGWIYGKVADKEGNAVQGAFMSCQWLDETGEYPQYMAANASTDSKGIYRAENIPPGEVAVKVEKKSYVSAEAKANVSEGAGTEVNFVVEKLEKCEVAIFVDSRYPKSTNWNDNPETVANSCISNLKNLGTAAAMVDAEELRAYMEANPKGVVVVPTGCAPDTIWDGKDESFVEKWLDAGGRMVWTGDWPFYYVGCADGTSKEIGTGASEVVLDFQPVTQYYQENTKFFPTGNGKKHIPSIHEFDVYDTRGGNIEEIEKNAPFYEIYANTSIIIGINQETPQLYFFPKGIADPCVFSPKGGMGYFVMLSMAHNDDAIPYDEQGLWIAELIKNRLRDL